MAKYTRIVLVFTMIFAVLTPCCPVLSQSDPPEKAVIINVPTNLTTVTSTRQQIDRAIEQGVKTIIFRFNGCGNSFNGFADLGREIAYLLKNKEVKTVAYIPSEAVGMTMLPVFACQQIIADEFAQMGKVLTDQKPDPDNPRPVVDEQTVENKIVSFAEAAGHNPLLARAMTSKRMILYEIQRGTETQLVDQAGFQTLVQAPNAQWQMKGTGPLVGSDEILLLSGKKSYELGLVAHLAANEQELSMALGVSLTDINLTGEPVTKAPEPVLEEKKEKAARNFVTEDKPAKAVVIVCKDMIDEGLYESIKRRVEASLADGANYIILEMDTFGGRVDSAISISNYLIHEVANKAYTIVYIPTEALSAGALISVACNDIIMKKATKLGDCAPIVMGGTLEGTEREKAESFLRSNFEASAKANGYPVALCKAMVTMTMEVWQVKNLQTGQNEYFEKDELSNLDPYVYDLGNKKKVDKDNELLTVDAEKAYEYGLARAVVDDFDGALQFLEERDGVKFDRPVARLTTTWSEELVRWLASPTVAGILLMVAMLGIYMELNSPGVVLPGAVAVVALVILFGSKYLIGMANWWEIAVFAAGLGLLIVEIFIIPGFGVTGILGIILIIFSLGAMMVGNRPDELPIPMTEFDWNLFKRNIKGALGGFAGFLLLAFIISKYLHKIPIANKLVLAAPQGEAAVVKAVESSTTPMPVVKMGQKGVSVTTLRPAGTARINGQKVDVVTKGEHIEAHQEIIVVEVEGNRIVVKKESDNHYFK